ncbi:RHS repeat-associated core domain-containing protein [Pseudomonas frederiksbergensis]|uniref:Toxin n=1 Tax=Pseudomonas frederiksbergensis TaxID=104087 RepID=A0A423KAF9_9PSED|nr:RHS repeat-associated core domain-containing protein [Pseudomonas frederiksbergensis]RON49048.1 toxin [Pseudomonas frederiksbergensis]
MNNTVHWRTPALAVNDSRGLPIGQVAYLRTAPGATAQALITRQQHDRAGRLTGQWDPRLYGHAPRPNLSTVYRLSGDVISTDSVDAGGRLSLAGVAGEMLQRWDTRGNHWRTTYDGQLRVIAVEENAQPHVERFTYADASADPGHNLRGQLTEQLDPSGRLRVDSYSLGGQALSDSRALADGQAYASRQVVSPLGVVLEQTDARGHQQRFRHDLAGQLQQVQLRIDADSAARDILIDARYNAAGQIIEQHAGNAVLSTWSYDPADGRLSHLKAQKNPEKALQDFAYFYDPMGNVVRIEDHGFTPFHFANQRIDGHRDFSYDSQYQLRSATGHDAAPPSDLPGRPLPGDPNDQRNYTQRYDYDPGGNLIRLSHEREGGSHTLQMFIDPSSNRGVRWKEGDPQPVIDELFDRNGNLLALRRGQPLSWNPRGQLCKVTLLEHGNGLPDDAETYLYSQGRRVYKSHKTHTPSAAHYHDVLYLPGLEIRTRDNGEELHVITLPGGRGQVRCLHWAQGQPAGIEANQLRYSLVDALDSCAMELDQQARVISHEGYYPFGGTAWLTAASQLEVSYKTVRYSGKEMDDSGLYYYGVRYYAAGLQRWVSADPAGDVDGLNLYAMVGNSPMVYVDETGESKGLLKSVNKFAGDIVGVAKKTSDAANKLDELATKFDGLVPEDADVEKLLKDLTFWKFLRTRHGLNAIKQGALTGAIFTGIVASVVPVAGTGIGALVGLLVGAIFLPAFRFYTLKKDLKMVQVLHTQEIKEGAQLIADTTNAMYEGAKSLASGGTELLDKIKHTSALIGAYSDQLQKVFYEQLNGLKAQTKREVIKVINTGIDPFEAIDQVLEAAADISHQLNEAESANQRLAELADVAGKIASTPIKPVPKPRIRFPQRTGSVSMA